MRILDIGYGTGSATKAWIGFSNEIIGVDLNGEATITGDWTKEETWTEIIKHGPYDWVWFSPDCAIFSMAGFGKNRPQHIKDGMPVSERAIAEVEGIEYVLSKIQDLDPGYGWVMENPRAMMRTMRFVKRYHRVTVTYCQYGDKRQKPTDLFGNIPMTFRPKMCKAGDRCHIATPRGSRHNKSTQSMGKVEAGRVPFGLSAELMVSVIVSKGRTYPTLEDYA